jgi:endonuclease YncB( thermonuclease family)
MHHLSIARFLSLLQLLSRANALHLLSPPAADSYIERVQEMQLEESSSSRLLSRITAEEANLRNAITAATSTLATTSTSSLELLRKDIASTSTTLFPIRDKVIRTLDANTIKLEKTGLVSLAGIYTPQTGGFPECTTTSPSKQLRRLLPPETPVRVRVLTSSNTKKNVKQVLVIKPSATTSSDAPTLIHAELVKTGFAKPVQRGQQEAEQVLPGITRALKELQQQAKQEQVGLYQICNNDNINNVASADSSKSVPTTANINLENQFEPIQFTTQTQWGADGGKTIRVSNNPESSSVPPKNPGDTKGCSDFETYEQALQWYETYYPYYGDVAHLDRTGRGIPCSGLPHTRNMERFRRKVPQQIAPKRNMDQ